MRIGLSRCELAAERRLNVARHGAIAECRKRETGAKRLPLAVQFPRDLSSLADTPPLASPFEHEMLETLRLCRPSAPPVPPLTSCDILSREKSSHTGRRTPNAFSRRALEGIAKYRGIVPGAALLRVAFNQQDGKMSTPATSPKTATLSLAHSPDSDDAFMFYALATGKVRLPGVKFNHILSDIETLNQAAHKETYDITAISFYGYTEVTDKYVLLDCGASFGEGYGPIVVSAAPIRKDDLAGRKIAIPGTRTSSYLALKLYEPNIDIVTIPFDKILDAVQAREVDAGLLIHEGQLLFSGMGLHKVVDLGVWWHDTDRPAHALRRECHSPQPGC